MCDAPVMLQCMLLLYIFLSEKEKFYNLNFITNLFYNYSVFNKSGIAIATDMKGD